MKVLYKDKKTEEICRDLRKAQCFFGGNKKLAISLLSRINACINAETIRDIIARKPFTRSDDDPYYKEALYEALMEKYGRSN